MKDGTPLPDNLSGNTIERLIRIDEALIYLISGALSYLVSREQLEQTGALTPEEAKLALSEMFTAYFEELPAMTPVGAIVMWTMDTIPDRWIVCDGTGYLKADYPELWALWGTKYGTSPDFFGSPNLYGRFPYGATVSETIDTAFGEATHTLTTAEMPSHNHAPLSPLTTFLGNRSGGSNTAPAGTGLGVVSTTANTGGGGAHNNIPPAYAVHFIAYGGKAP